MGVVGVAEAGGQWGWKESIHMPPPPEEMMSLYHLSPTTMDPSPWQVALLLLDACTAISDHNIGTDLWAGREGPSISFHVPCCNSQILITKHILDPDQLLCAPPFSNPRPSSVVLPTFLQRPVL